jgi:hypothetical protein
MQIEIEKTRNPKSAIRNPKFNGPMLFAQEVLAPGPVKEDFWGYASTFSIGRRPNFLYS